MPNGHSILILWSEIVRQGRHEGWVCDLPVVFDVELEYLVQEGTKSSIGGLERIQH